MAARLLLMGMLLTVSSAAHAGTITMTSTAYPDSVVINLTITDTGEVSGCGWLTVLRDGQETFLYVQRQVGTTIVRRLVDTNVQPNTLYCYQMDLRLGPIPFACPTGNFCTAFECFVPTHICVNTGPDPAFLGHGLLSSKAPDGTPLDGIETQALLYPCGSPDNVIGLWQISSDAWQYIDSGIDVNVYGAYACCLPQGVWALEAQLATPEPCVLKVESATWGKVKSLYRD
jgi:hypothetical protein